MVRKKYIYDLPTRIMHAGIGVSTLLLLITAGLAHLFFEEGAIRHDLWMIHIYLGNLLLVFLAFRIVYLFIGPKYSRISNFIKLNEWSAILKSLLVKKKPGPVSWPWGHHPMASFLYLIVYLSLSVLGITGLFLTRIQFDEGPVPEKFYDDVEWLTSLLKTHESLAYFLIAFTFLHLGALYYHMKKDQLPIFESMKTGFQYKHDQEGEPQNEII